MATNTPNLNLYKYNPTTDGNETFNIDTALNENWDKVDVAIKSHSEKAATTAQPGHVKLSTAISDDATTAITPNAVKNALSNVSADTASLQVNVIDLAIEMETTKNAELNGVTANIAIETFLNLNDVTLDRGGYNSTNKWLEV